MSKTGHAERDFLTQFPLTKDILQSQQDDYLFFLCWGPSLDLSPVFQIILLSLVDKLFSEVVFQLWSKE